MTRDVYCVAPVTSAGDVRRAAAGVDGVAFAPGRLLRELADVPLGGLVGSPLGHGRATVKAIEATSLAKDNARVIEVTPWPAGVLDGTLRDELLEIARGARAVRASIVLMARIDLSWGAPDVAAIGAEVIRGAFDGITLAGDDVASLAAAVRRARTVEGLIVSAIARDATWTDALAAAGAQRVGVLSPSPRLH